MMDKQLADPLRRLALPPWQSTGVIILDERGGLITR